MIMGAKRQCFIATALVIVILLFPCSVMAQEAGPMYFGVFGGYVWPGKVEVKPLGSTEVDVDNSWMLGAKVGYIPPQWRFAAAELEYFHMFDQSVKSQTVMGVNVNGNVSFDNLMVNVRLRYPEGIINPYIGAGIGSSWYNFSGTPSDSSTNFAWQILAGVTSQITKQWSVDLGYRYFSTVPQSSNQVTLGVNFHF
jgi:opacity protein-like surface antigen